MTNQEYQNLIEEDDSKKVFIERLARLFLEQSRKKAKGEKESPSNNESGILKMKTGLLLLSAQNEMNEAEYSAMDRITFDGEVFRLKSDYAGELIRTLEEMELTTDLMSQVSHTDDTSGPRQPEDVINYYIGIYLDLVHQTKDKLFRLLFLLLDGNKPGRRYKDPDNTKVPNFLKRHGEQLKAIGIWSELEKWQQEDGGAIGVILSKRTHHHHKISGLRLNDLFQSIKISRLFPDKKFNKNGESLKLLGIKAFEGWKDDAILKQKQSTLLIEKNLESITKNLIAHFKIPTNPEDVKKIGEAYNDFLSKFQIENRTSITKIDPDFEEVIQPLIKNTHESLGDQLVSIYLVGSVGRGDSMPGVSDVNIYVITREHSRESKLTYSVEVTVISEADFHSQRYLKERFICWSDGLLIFGKELKINKREFPKPGLWLSLLLNRGYRERLRKIETETASLVEPDPKILRDYSVAAAKIMLDFDFGVAMSNSPYYSPNRKERIEHTRQEAPELRRVLIFESLYNAGYLSQEDFPIVINAFLRSTLPSYEKLLEIEKSAIDEQSR